MDGIQERSFREHNIELIASSPSAIYKIIQTNGDEYTIDSPSKMPDRTTLKEIHEPIPKVAITTPLELIGGCMDLCQNSRR